MPAPWELPQQMPTPGQKLGCKSPRVGATFWCKSLGVHGGVVMHEIDTCIRLELGLLVLMKEENQSNFDLDFVTIRNQYDVLKTGEAGGFITKDQLRT